MWKFKNFKFHPDAALRLLLHASISFDSILIIIYVNHATSQNASERIQLRQ